MNGWDFLVATILLLAFVTASRAEPTPHNAETNCHSMIATVG